MNKLLAALLTILLASPVHAFRFEVGVYSGNGADGRDISTSASFAISAMIIKCNGATHATMKTSSMAADAADDLGGGGGITTNKIQSFGTGTFQVGSSSTTNVSGTDNCFYVAWGADANNDLAVGTYVGDGNDLRDIVISPAFQPGAVILASESDNANVWRVSAMSGEGDFSLRFAASPAAANLIQAFNADGLEIGTDFIVNYATGGTVDYYPLAVKDVTNYTASGTYTAGGSPSDGLAITVGFQPDLVIVKSDTNAGVGVVRTSAMTGDFACPMTNVACNTNFIQSFTATGFTIGTSASVQSAGVKYWWYAIKTPVYAGGGGSTRRAPIIIQ